jgi:hypothetical protein
MNDTDVTDWKFIDFKDIPQGPWATHGENNTFVQLARANGGRLVSNKPAAAPIVAPLTTGAPAEIFQPIR